MLLLQTSPDVQTRKGWAAEHIAIELGVLRECPYHGEPLRSQAPLPDILSYCALELDDPLFSVFRGDAGEMIAAVQSLLTRHGETCPMCDRDGHTD